MNRLTFVPLLGAMLLVGEPAPVSTSGQETAFVQVSRARLREAPSAGARTLGYLNTNQGLEVYGRAGEWCEVREQNTSRRGFVACRLLAPAALTREAIQAALATPSLTRDQRVEWLARAYWVSPSLLTLLRTGEAPSRRTAAVRG